MSKKLILLLLVAALQAVRVAALNVTISPDRMRARQGPSNVSFTCAADSALVGCQFSWWNYRYSKAGPLLDLSQGPQSQADPAHLDDKLTGYSYTGWGLGTGDCGVSLAVKGLKMWVIACRVRAVTGGWKYAWANLYANNWNPIPNMLTTPREVVVLPGGVARFMMKAQGPLRECIFRLPGVSGQLNFYQGAESNHSTGRHHYLGAGLQSGECGLTLTNISEADNGLVRLFIHAAGAKDDYRLMALIVAHPPPAPTLSLTNTDNTVTATCEVGGSRPAANMTWLLDYSIIRQDDVDESQARSSDEWRWPWMQASIKQTITRQVNPQDNGKFLKCQVSHLSLGHHLQLVLHREISFTGPISCLPLNSNTLNITCVLNGTVSCAERLLPGTVAYLYCKTGYVLAQPRPLYNNVTCQEDGTWNKNVFECILNCGKRMIKDGFTLITNGDDANIGEFPWHIAIYRKVGNQSYAYICGGTLIKDNLVVSAAHCFWDNQNGSQNSPSMYKIAAGKHYRDWGTELEPEPPQRRDVAEIIIPQRYRGRESNYVQDIALLRLSSPVEISKSVNVVCIDWDNEREIFALEPNNNGTVPGWRYPETGLKVVDLPYIPYQMCRQAVPPETRRFLTVDKFCAGYVNKSIGVCRGSGGGGIVFLDTKYERYFIRGIFSVSLEPAGNTDISFLQLYAAFTTFSQYISWIRKFY